MAFFNITPPRLILPFAFCLLVLGSCTDDVEQNLSEIDRHFIDENKAKELTDNLDVISYVNGKKKSALRTVETLTPIVGDKKDTVFYVVNYNPFGFVILSADDRTQPVLGYSLDNKFPLKYNKYPNGLVEWLFGVKEKIKQIRSENTEHSSYSKKWNKASIENFIQSPLPTASLVPEPGPIGGCQNEHTKVGPLLETNWGQWGAYNDDAPNYNCNTADGRVPTGCVATAMAQIIKFHEFPANYNYNQMPNNSGSAETSILMRDIGDAVNMDWGCDGSSASTKDEVASSLTNDFGYSSATYADWNNHQTIVKQEIDAERPVVLAGGRRNGWWIFGVYSDGHAWVCDGYRTSYYCETGTSTLNLHMNWGWGNNILNGWYAYTNWNPGSHTFNYKKKLVYNIIP